MRAQTMSRHAYLSVVIPLSQEAQKDKPKKRMEDRGRTATGAAGVRQKGWILSPLVAALPQDLQRNQNT